MGMPRRQPKRTRTAGRRGPLLAVGGMREAVRELREQAVIAEAHIVRCLGMVTGEGPPNGETLYRALVGAQRAAQRTREQARHIDDAIAARRRDRGRRN